MRSWKRLIFFLFINIVVSALTTVTVIYLWERSQQPVVPVQLTQLPAAAGSDSAASQAASASSPGVHRVAFGDTLASIAAAYGVTVEELMQANGLSDQTAIGVGQELIIPASVPATPDSVGQGGALESTSEPEYRGGLEIVSVVGAGDLQAERVNIRYRGEGQVFLDGWQLLGEEGERFVFPRLSLFKDGSVTVYSAPGSDTAVNLYWGREAAAWQPGITVRLLDPQGNVQVEYIVP